MKASSRLPLLPKALLGAALVALPLCGMAEDPVPQLLSNASIASMHWADGSMTANNGREGFGGGTGIGNFFDGNITSGVYIGPNGRLNNNGFCLLDFALSGNMPAGGWFITEIKISNCESGANYAYSLYYSTDGTAFAAVPNATNVKAPNTRTFTLNEQATHIRVVFNQIGGWTPTVSEIQVYGVDPADMSCQHPSFSAWTPVPDTATCLGRGIDEQFCTVCGERFTRESETLLPAGHLFTSFLDDKGKYRHFGSGAIVCTRTIVDPVGQTNTWSCNWVLPCPEPLDLITNKVNGDDIGIIKTDGLFPFTDVSVTSTGDTGYGVRPSHLITGNWGWGWNNYWYAANKTDDQHVDYEFGTEIDLAWIDISVHNDTQAFQFYSVDDNGEETQLTGFMLYRIDEQTGGASHMAFGEDAPGMHMGMYEDGNGNFFVATNRVPKAKCDQYHWVAPTSATEYEVYQIERIGAQDNTPPELFDQLYVVQDDAVSSADGQGYQRFIVRFYATPITHLRIRQAEVPGGSMMISELHPWGTVKGAGDWPNDRTTIISLK